MKKIACYAVALGAVVSCSDATTAPPSVWAPTPMLPSAAPSASGQPIPNQYIVRFPDNEPSSLARARLIERTHGAVVQRVYDTAIKGAALTMADDAAEALKTDAGIVSVEQDQTVRISTTQLNPTWGLDRIDQHSLPLSNSYSYNFTGAGVTAYIIDTGINFTHTEYNGRASFGVDEIVPSTNGVDCNGHGSHVSGTVGGTTYGVAKNVSLVAVRVLDCSGSGSYAAVIAGVDWVTANAHKPAVANMSLGGPFSSALNAAVTNSMAAGVVYAVAAGNSAYSACNDSPSSTPGTLSTGATSITDVFASFSNFGSCVAILAPGVNVTSAWIGSNTATMTISGTSMASPHAAGAAALYLEANPTATPAQVSSALTSNATPNAITGVPSGTPNLLVYTAFLGVSPTANFTSSCSALACSFDASSSTALTGATYSWSFGDSQTGSGKTTSHTYAAAGTYTVTLTVTDANGTGTTSKNVTVSAANQPPVASFTVNCVGQSIPNQCAFDLTSTTGNIVKYVLAFGDGKSVTLTPPANLIGKHTYPAPGVYTPTLAVTDANGLTSSTSRQAVVGNPPPTVSISAPSNNAIVVLGTSVTFTGSATDPVDGTLTGSSLVWTSSIDGNIGTGTTFAKSNLSGGKHTITLTATNSHGASSTATITLIVDFPPTASISAPANGTSVAQGASVTFTGSASDPEDGVLSGASLQWTSNIDGAIGSGTSFSKSNLSLGTHTITLTAKDSQGATGTATITMTVTAQAFQPPTATISAPANGTSVVQGTSVTFTGSANDPQDGVLTGSALTWTSSINGAIGTGTSFSTSTLSVGTHTITLTAKDSKGLTGTASITVTITAPQPPTATISAPANGTSVVQGSSVTFTGSANDPQDGVLTGSSLAWTSSINGAIGTGTSFSTSTLSVGTHTITLTATDSKGLTGTASITLTVTAAPPPPPVANFTWSCTGFNPHQCQFDATSSTGNIIKYVLNLGDGLTITMNVLVGKHTYSAAGTYQVTLTVTDNLGRTNAVTKAVIVP